MAIHVNSQSNIANSTNRAAVMLVAYNAAVCASDILLWQNNIRKYNSTSNAISTFLDITIESGDNNVMKAGDNIQLGAVFRALPGSTFRAYIDSCDNLPIE